jgi:hypothetical protein
MYIDIYLYISIYLYIYLYIYTYISIAARTERVWRRCGASALAVNNTEAGVFSPAVGHVASRSKARSFLLVSTMYCLCTALSTLCCTVYCTVSCVLCPRRPSRGQGARLGRGVSLSSLLYTCCFLLAGCFDVCSRWSTQHNTTQHTTPQHNTTQHNATQHNTTHCITTHTQRRARTVSWCAVRRACAATLSHVSFALR